MTNAQLSKRLTEVTELFEEQVKSLSAELRVMRGRVASLEDELALAVIERNTMANKISQDVKEVHKMIERRRIMV